MAMISSSSSSHGTALKKYDVFISFQGETRTGFTSHLYAALSRSEFHTYYIDHRIEKGDEVWSELVKAIKESTLFLVVFSENYASSTRCLNELVEIMECSNKNEDDNVVVIPVFYHVDPSHVRKQTGSYGTALAKHENQGNKDDKMMQNWKNSLFQAANISGFHSTEYRIESDLIEDITRAVLGKINYKYTNELTCSFILNENHWSIQSLIKIDSSDVQIIGLWGIGAKDKTTLATAKLQSQYEGNCLLENVTEESKRHGINDICNKLLSKLLRENLGIYTPKVIPSRIKSRPKHMKYDVFINFHGNDTRSCFISHLHAALCRTHLNTYIDYQIEKGKEVWAELVKAIKQSTLYLVVFSENYASSTWCLNELIAIMECSNKNEDDNVVVIPVFYHIDPSHVRKQIGSYDTALVKHKKQGNSDDKMIQSWKNALFQVANLSYFHSTISRTESDLIEDITRSILDHQNTNDRSCDFIIDENYWSIKSLIKFDSTEVQIIGLWGMAGIGKTTLAAAMFKRTSFKYEGSCFLEKVTEVSKRHGINYTCNKLLSKLLREDLDIDTSKLIPSMIMRRLKRMKSFIVLDDVHNLELLQNLIGVGHGWLGSGSTVIVTTRDKHVLISEEIDKIYEVKKMNSRNSLQLFSLNAFDSVSPKDGYVELSKRAIDYAKGNPLALTVLGSSLRCKSEIEWDCALAKLEEIPNTEIDSILRMSFYELDETEQNIFLDIACFFKGHKRNSITKILNECGFFADIGICYLLDKALVRVDFENCIQMHGLIHEMGKQIVREESLKDPGQRSRLCDPKEVYDVLKNNRGTEIVEAIFLDATEYTHINLRPGTFEKMVNLRLLAIQDYKGIKSVSLPYGLDFLPENLRYFVWDGYPLKSLPPTFCPEMLVVLSLKESHVEKLWNEVLNLPNLETLDLIRSKNLITCPNVSGCPNLKCVILKDCESMPEVDSSIFFLQKLEVLDVSGCKSLKSLSGNICSPAFRQLDADCINLKEFSVTFTSVDRLSLSLSEWDGNELPSSILHTKNLHTFSFPISDCLVDLPKNFCNNIWLMSQRNREQDPFNTLDKVLSSPAFLCVKQLTFSVIPILSKIPDSISSLLSLESLTLDGMAIRSLPETIMYLPQLKKVAIFNCEMLQSIPALSRFIPNLVVWDCESLEKVLRSTDEPYDEPNLCCLVLLNCTELDPPSYQTVLKDAIDAIDASLYDDIIWQFLPALPGMGNWFHNLSTQVSVTLELPSNLLGFAYYLVLSQGEMEFSVRFGCECYLDNSSGERICITSVIRGDFMFPGRDEETSFHMTSDHLVLWYDPQIYKHIMDAVELTKANSDVNSTSYNPKLTFKFFIDETLYDEVAIKECGLHWIYQQETVSSSTISEYHDVEETVCSSDCQSNEQEEIIPPTNFESDDLEETFPPRNKLKLDIVGTPPSNLELDETHDLRCSLEELMHHMNTTWFGSTEEESNS